MQARREALELPLRLPCLVLIGSIVGFCLGSLQCRMFAHLPLAECVKNVLFSIPIVLLYALLVYFVLSETLRPVVERACELLPETHVRPKVPLFLKVTVCLMVSLVVTIFVMGLMAYTSSQRMLASLHLANQDQLLGETLRGTLMVTAFLLGVAILLAIGLARNLLRPLNLLTTIASRPADRLLEPLTPCHTDDELEAYQSFRKLVGELGTTQSDLAQANRDLAEKVQVRTREDVRAALAGGDCTCRQLDFGAGYRAAGGGDPRSRLANADACALWLLGPRGYEVKATRGIESREMGWQFDLAITHRRPLSFYNTPQRSFQPGCGRLASKR